MPIPVQLSKNLQVRLAFSPKNYKSGICQCQMLNVLVAGQDDIVGLRHLRRKSLKIVEFCNHKLLKREKYYRFQQFLMT